MQSAFSPFLWIVAGFLLSCARPVSPKSPAAVPPKPVDWKGLRGWYLRLIVAEESGDLFTAKQAAMWLARLDGETPSTQLRLSRFYQRNELKEQEVWWLRLLKNVTFQEEAAAALVAFYLERGWIQEARTLQEQHPTGIGALAIAVVDGDDVSVLCKEVSMDQATQFLPLLFEAKCYKEAYEASLSRVEVGYDDGVSWLWRSAQKACEQRRAYEVVVKRGLYLWPAYQEGSAQLFEAVSDEERWQQTASQAQRVRRSLLTGTLPDPQTTLPEEFVLAALVLEGIEVDFHEYSVEERRLAVEVALNVGRYEQVLLWTNTAVDRSLLWARAGAYLALGDLQSAREEARRSGVDQQEQVLREATVIARAGQLPLALLLVSSLPREDQRLWLARWAPRELLADELTDAQLQVAVHTLGSQGELSSQWALVATQRLPCHPAGWRFLSQSEERRCEAFDQLYRIEPLGEDLRCSSP